jgi:hypothetical protein
MHLNIEKKFIDNSQYILITIVRRNFIESRFILNILYKLWELKRF